MNKDRLQDTLSSLPINTLRYFDSLGSTNDEALAWAAQGAPNLSLVVADEQTSGRGRAGRSWFTPPGAALAFSLILRPSKLEAAHPSLTTGLLAVSLVDALQEHDLACQIKWPNDVLLNGRKLAGILVESTWTGEKVDAFVLGMGVNVFKSSIPPETQTSFPATSIESELGRPLPRETLLFDILNHLLRWRTRMGKGVLVEAWTRVLAYQGEQVRVEARSGDAVIGELLGLESDGSLRLRDNRGKVITVHHGEVHLRPLT